ncbi:AAA family ATPase [Haliangium sp.]|uniref:AAA family ATPase n=1 Tax=Haliangium sp. TaxID=2663208 RepID=UPI003D0AB447
MTQRPRQHPQTPGLLRGMTDLRGRYGPYHPADGLVDAADAARLLGRPLLLTGAPGCGKTDFAWVLAKALSRDPEATPLECHIHSGTTARELLYHYDALLRFGDSQHGNDSEREDARDPRRYIELRPLGVALMSPERQVLLIDEIDKAPRDLPNDLLRELDAGEFEIAEVPTRVDRDDDPAYDQRTDIRLRRHMRPQAADSPGAIHPIVVITSNVERQLPDAFLRRCVFYHIEFPDHDSLRTIVSERVGIGPRDSFLDDVLALFAEARKVTDLSKPPGTAELLDWVTVLSGGLYEDDHVGAIIAEAKAAIAGPGQLGRGWRWSKLPGAGCLFKLSEDQRRADRLCAGAG